MIEGALAKPDLAVVGHVATHDELLAEAAATRPNFVIVGVDGTDLPRSCRTLLVERPSTRIFGIDATAGDAHLYELTAVRMHEITPDELVEAIRDRARRPAGTVEGHG